MCTVHGEQGGTGKTASDRNTINKATGALSGTLTTVSDTLSTVSSSVTAVGDSLTGKVPLGTIRDFTTEALAISAITKANPSEVTCAAHGRTGTFTVVIASSNSNPSIDGIRTATYVSATKFTVPVNVNVSAGTSGSVYVIPAGWTPTTATGHTTGGVDAFYLKYTG